VKKLLILIILSVTFTISCKKQEIEPTYPVNHKPQKEVNTQGVRIYGEWLLIGGTMYVDNLETGEKVKYQHFDNNKTTSSLRYGGSLYEFENIEINKTTWSFYEPSGGLGVGEFVLNNDTSMLFGFNVTRNNWTIIEHPESGMDDLQLGGSARPISAYVEDFDEEICIFTVQETYENIKGYNSKYISELKFKKTKEW
jgi:hypothetical protein